MALGGIKSESMARIPDHLELRALQKVQRRMWLFAQRESGTAVLYTPVSRPLRRPLDVHGLERGWSMLSALHELTRTEVCVLVDLPLSLASHLAQAQDPR
jgi:hypothetical protein